MRRGARRQQQTAAASVAGENPGRRPSALLLAPNIPIGVVLPAVDSQVLARARRQDAATSARKAEAHETTVAAKRRRTAAMAEANDGAVHSLEQFAEHARNSLTCAVCGCLAAVFGRSVVSGCCTHYLCLSCMVMQAYQAVSLLSNHTYNVDGVVLHYNMDYDNPKCHFGCEGLVANGAMRLPTRRDVHMDTGRAHMLRALQQLFPEDSDLQGLSSSLSAQKCPWCPFSSCLSKLMTHVTRCPYIELTCAFCDKAYMMSAPPARGEEGFDTPLDALEYAWAAHVRRGCRAIKCRVRSCSVTGDYTFMRAHDKVHDDLDSMVQAFSRVAEAIVDNGRIVDRSMRLFLRDIAGTMRSIEVNGSVGEGTYGRHSFSEEDGSEDDDDENDDNDEEDDDEDGEEEEEEEKEDDDNDEDDEQPGGRITVRIFEGNPVNITPMAVEADGLACTEENYRRIYNWLVRHVVDKLNTTAAMRHAMLPVDVPSLVAARDSYVDRVKMWCHDTVKVMMRPSANAWPGNAWPGVRAAIMPNGGRDLQDLLPEGDCIVIDAEAAYFFYKAQYHAQMVDIMGGERAPLWIRYVVHNAWRNMRKYVYTADLAPVLAHFRDIGITCNPSERLVIRAQEDADARPPLWFSGGVAMLESVLRNAGYDGVNKQTWSDSDQATLVSNVLTVSERVPDGYPAATCAMAMLYTDSCNVIPPSAYTDAAIRLESHRLLAHADVEAID